MAVSFNSVNVNFVPPDETEGVTLRVRSHSESGNDRPDIDITTSADSRRVSVPGFAAVEKHTFEVVIDDATDRTTLAGWLDDCQSGTLNIQAIFCTDSQPTTLMTMSAWMTGLTYSGDLDGAITASVEFTRDHRPT